MKLTWLSDTHFNFIDDAAFEVFAQKVRDTRTDAIVITGDISTSKRFAVDLRELFERTQQKVFFVLGNHDYYHSVSIEKTRRLARKIGEVAHTYYLRDYGPIKLDTVVWLVGVDGWGDARNGNMLSPVILNDFIHIPDLAGKNAYMRNALLNRLGELEAEQLKFQLEAAFDQGARVIVVATHVPPFESAAFHEDSLCEPDYLPFFSCAATGDVLNDFAEKHRQDCDILVLCGHTHSSGEYKSYQGNMNVLTGSANYGAPIIQRIIDTDTIGL